MSKEKKELNEQELNNVSGGQMAVDAATALSKGDAILKTKRAEQKAENEKAKREYGNF